MPNPLEALAAILGQNQGFNLTQVGQPQPEGGVEGLIGRLSAPPGPGQPLTLADLLQRNRALPRPMPVFQPPQKDPRQALIDRLLGRGQFGFDRGGGMARGGQLSSKGPSRGSTASSSSSASGGGGGGGSGGGSGGGCFARGTPIQMANGEIVPIEEISLGDDALGGLVTGTMILHPEQMYDYKGTKVSGSQSVLEGKWIHVKDSPLAGKIALSEPIFHFNCEHHLIYIGDVVFADYSYYPVEDDVAEWKIACREAA